MQKPLWILLPALGLGVAGKCLMSDTFFHSAPTGAGFTIWVLLNIAAAAVIVRVFNPSLTKVLLFLIPAVFASIGFSLVDSSWLWSMDLAVVMLSTCFTCFAVANKGGTIFKSVTSVFAALFTGMYLPIFGAIDLFCTDLKYKGLVSEDQLPVLKAVLKGIGIAAPLLLLFTGLFCAADQKFAYMLGHTFKFNWLNGFSEAVVVATLTLFSGGILRTLGLIGKAVDSRTSADLDPGADAMGDQAQVDLRAPVDTEGLGIQDSILLTADHNHNFNVPLPDRHKIGFVEGATALTLINILFASFVAVQLRYLFGGASMISATPGLNYAEYARHGFFELCTVASLVLPLLLSVDALCLRATKNSEMVMRALQATLVGFVLVVLASAMQRMHLYTVEFGLSELRFYTQAFMVWLAVVCLGYTVTVLRANRGAFTKLAYITGLISIAALHVINPDALIQTTNLPLGLKQKYDSAYALTLSNDGIPALVDGMQTLPQDKRQIIAQSLLSQRKGAWHTDWRSFNLSRVLAYRAVQKHLTEIEVASK